MSIIERLREQGINTPVIILSAKRTVNDRIMDSDMLLKKLIKQYHTLAFRLTLWYAAIFIISSFLAFLIFYLSAASIVLGRMDKEILEELEEFSQLLSSNGIDDLKREVLHEIESEDAEKIFFRVLKSDGSEILGKGV